MKLNRGLIPDIATLQAFECAARHGSFTQAAKELSLTQSAVSRQIKELESQLGVLLFERVRQRVLLSDAGQKFLPEARRLLNLAEDTMLRAMSAAASPASLSIATLPTFGDRWLLPRLPDFLVVHPDITLNVASRSEPFDFEEEPFDLAIHYGQPIWAHANCTYLCSERVIPVASPAFLAKHRIETLDQLANAPLLQVATRPKAWADWFNTSGTHAASPYRGHRFEHFSLVIEAAIAGMGCALLPEYLVEFELKSGRLNIVFNTGLKTENSYYIVIPETKAENKLAHIFCEWAISQVSR
ncbi:MAG: LysR family transcriptional regulator [Phyllobacterium sp.]